MNSDLLKAMLLKSPGVLLNKIEEKGYNVRGKYLTDDPNYKALKVLVELATNSVKDPKVFIKDTASSIGSSLVSKLTTLIKGDANGKK